jgi:hypothetical protein
MGFTQTVLEMGDALFRERRHRHNVDVARRKFLNMPGFGHYDTWLIDLLQILIEENSRKLLYPNSLNADTDECFVVVPLHNETFQTKLDERVAYLKRENAAWVPSLTDDQKFMCMAMGVTLPFTPVDGPAEYNWFSKIMMRHEFPRFDSEKMAMIWMD